MSALNDDWEALPIELVSFAENCNAEKKLEKNSHETSIKSEKKIPLERRECRVSVASLVLLKMSRVEQIQVIDKRE